MSIPTKAVITFEEIFSWLFNPIEKISSDERFIPELPVHLIKNGAIQKLKQYCNDRKIPFEIKDLKENVISIRVTV